MLPIATDKDRRRILISASITVSAYVCAAIILFLATSPSSSSRSVSVKSEYTRLRLSAEARFRTETAPNSGVPDAAPVQSDTPISTTAPAASPRTGAAPQPLVPTTQRDHQILPTNRTTSAERESETAGTLGESPAARSVPAGPERDRENSANHSVTFQHTKTAVSNDLLLSILDEEIKRALIYPERARKRNVEGQVILKIAIQSDGTLLNAAIEHSSENAILDTAALELIRSVFPLPIPELSVRPFTASITIEYKLSE